LALAAKKIKRAVVSPRSGWMKPLLKLKGNGPIYQDHRFIKKITNPMKGFKAFHLAKALSLIV
jgi:transposase-like protein